MKRIKSHFKRNWQIYVASAFAGALAIWFIAYCREFYAFSDTSIRPFAADVWGTVSDWAMVVVTIVTAYFIWRTLNSQVAVQKAQSEMLKIEMNRRIAEIKPSFSFVSLEESKFESDKLFLKLNKNDVYVANVHLSFTIFSSNVSGASQKKSLSNAEVQSNDLRFTFVKGKINLNYNSLIILGLEFEDELGTQYTQMIMIDWFGGKFSSNNTMPIKLGERRSN